MKSLALMEGGEMLTCSLGRHALSMWCFEVLSDEVLQNIPRISGKPIQGVLQSFCSREFRRLGQSVNKLSIEWIGKPVPTFLLDALAVEFSI
jgi:hypothetical protein